MVECSVESFIYTDFRNIAFASEICVNKIYLDLSYSILLGLLNLIWNKYNEGNWML